LARIFSNYITLCFYYWYSVFWIRVGWDLTILLDLLYWSKTNQVYIDLIHCKFTYSSYVSIQSCKFNLCAKLEYHMKHLRIKHCFHGVSWIVQELNSLLP